MNPTHSGRTLRHLVLLCLLVTLPSVGGTGCARLPGGGAGGGGAGAGVGGFGGAPGLGAGAGTGGAFDPTGGAAGAGGAAPGLGLPGTAAQPGTTPGLGATTPVTPPPAGGRSAFEQQVDQSMLQQLNALRQQAGLQALRFDERLLAASYAHATDMATKGYFSHTGQDGSSPSSRAARTGYRGGVAENIAQNSARGDAAATARAILQQYWESPGHKTNMMGRSWTICGLGTNTRRGAYNCQMFGRQ